VLPEVEVEQDDLGPGLPGGGEHGLGAQVVLMENTRSNPWAPRAIFSGSAMTPW
jgi:hypothetical protein